jgi:hypothetical protein
MSSTRRTALIFGALFVATFVFSIGGVRRHGRGDLPILRRQNETLALGYVTARLVECTFIAIGVVSLLAVVTLRQKAGGEDPGSLVADARTLVAVRDWTFVLGPGFLVGIGNGLILGYLMYTSGSFREAWRCWDSSEALSSAFLGSRWCST